MIQSIVIHYDEIALKGKNRHYFEHALVRNLNDFLKFGGFDLRAQNAWGRIYIDGNTKGLSKEDTQKLKESLSLFPGVSYFGFAFVAQNYEADKQEIAKIFVPKLQNTTFRVSAKRVNKNFPLNSSEIERDFANTLFEIEPNLSASMRDFETELQVELLHDKILFYIKEKSIGGLPTGTSGKIISSISAGFDSPVASFLMQKRGAKLEFLHFHAKEKTGNEPFSAVKELVQTLSNYQGYAKLYTVDVLDIQKHIAQNAPDKLRIVLLRRSFLRVANSLANTLNAQAICTGDSLGQVASQTIENLLAVNEASSLPVLRPLIGFNKSEIIDLSRKIKTHNTSSRPCDDACALFVPKNPETKAKLDEVLKVESNLNLEPLEQKALSLAQVFEFKYGKEIS